jgi:hypothetical protein
MRGRVLAATGYLLSGLIESDAAAREPGAVSQRLGGAVAADDRD